MIIKNSKTIDGKKLVDIFKIGEEVAYNAVKKPVKGTILTVITGIKLGSIKALNKKNDLLFIFKEAILAGNKVLNKTPDYLPVLKEAGVVDAGGKGLLVILEGLYKGVIGESIICESSDDVITTTIFDNKANYRNDIKFIYCTELIILNPLKDNDSIRCDLDKMKIGDSLVTIVSDGIAKIHIHTNNPDKLLKYTLSLGELTNIKIENMVEQFEKNNNIKIEKQKNKSKKENGFVMIVPGKGLGKIAKSMGVDAILYGGQTMNPSTSDIQEVIDTVDAKIIYLLPNNKNIILASDQVSKLSNNKKIIVVPSTTVPEGFNSLLSFNEICSSEKNLKMMKESFKNIISGSVTYAIRDSIINGFDIKKNQILILKRENIIGVKKSIKEAMDFFVKKNYRNHDILTIYAGNMISKNDANKLKKYLNDKYKNLEIVLFFGEQSVYYYLMSLE